MKYDNIERATYAWVNEFSALPLDVVTKLFEASGCCDFYEVTPPSRFDRVYVYNACESGERYGEITGYDEDEDVYVIELDDKTVVRIERDEFDVERDSHFPMWGTMWTFKDSVDDWWLEQDNNLQAMADCGFRIYESEDLGYVFGIDGAGYDFYESHWIPLYKVRGLQWHKNEFTDDENMGVEEAAMKNLCNAMIEYGKAFCWTDTDVVLQLENLGFTKEDFEMIGQGFMYKQVYEEGVE